MTFVKLTLGYCEQSWLYRVTNNGMICLLYDTKATTSHYTAVEDKPNPRVIDALKVQTTATFSIYVVLDNFDAVQNLNKK